MRRSLRFTVCSDCHAEIAFPFEMAILPRSKMQLLCGKCITTLRHTFQCGTFLVPQCIAMLWLWGVPLWGDI